jgi:hypothetical protein
MVILPSWLSRRCPPWPEWHAAGDPLEPALLAKCNCTYRPADDRFRACRLDDQNISRVTGFDPFFRILLVF